MREIWSKQAQVLRIQTCSYELGLNWNFGDLTFFSMMWTTRELAMMASKMNYTLALHWTADEPTQGSKTDQAQKGGHGGAIWK